MIVDLPLSHCKTDELREKGRARTYDAVGFRVTCTRVMVS